MAGCGFYACLPGRAGPLLEAASHLLGAAPPAPTRLQPLQACRGRHACRAPPQHASTTPVFGTTAARSAHIRPSRPAIAPRRAAPGRPATRTKSLSLPREGASGRPGACIPAGQARPQPPRPTRRCWPACLPALVQEAPKRRRLDEYDQEYDKGRTKKVRGKRGDGSGSNEGRGVGPDLDAAWRQQQREGAQTELRGNRKRRSAQSHHEQQQQFGGPASRHGGTRGGSGGRGRGRMSPRR